MGCASPTIVDKPWGREVIYAETDVYIGKLIEVDQGHRLSLQYHECKDETIYVLEGTLSLVVGPTKSELQTRDLPAGSSIRIVPGTVHRYAAPFGSVRILEVSTPHPDDVVRLSDDYGRADRAKGG